MAREKVEISSYLTPTEINGLPSKKPELTYSYGDQDKQILELRIPHGGLKQYPVILVIHGGCWKEKFATLQNTAALADALRDNGFATLNVEYRCIDSKGGGWPGTFLDIAQAVESVKVLSKKFPLDLNRVVAIGHSSGGTLALWASARHKIPKETVLYLPEPLHIKGAISLGGIGDLQEGVAHLDVICGKGTIFKLLGYEKELSNENLKVSSPAELMPIGKPQIFITGANDRAVPPKFGEKYIEKAKTVGDGKFVSQFVVQGCGHHEYNHPGKETFSIIINQIQRILEEK